MSKMSELASQQTRTLRDRNELLFYRLLSRQPRGWTTEYEPGIRANPKEAPRMSRPSLVYAGFLGRDIHLLSVPERKAALLALYNPWLFSIQEQLVLSTDPWPHPLYGYPGVSGMPWFRGTVDVAVRLGCISSHPRVTIQDPSGGSKMLRAPMPFVGDLLLFLKGSDNSPYCVNWTIKKDGNGFRRGLGLRQTLAGQAREEERSQRRHEIENVYYQDVGIPTVRVTEADIDTHVAANLQVSYTYFNRTTKLDARSQEILIQRYGEIIGSKISVLECARSLCVVLGCTLDDCKIVLHQAIWKRKLRVDLFRPVLFDRPLNIETCDVLGRYAYWFARRASS
ncbi:PDDEXK family nuclease [Paraburkholderia aspalathi]|uniref:hypothetical protein n=1 Tax=Paraburkholderia aspalathi TaxID=1324617 RepID=UPI0038B7F602